MSKVAYLPERDIDKYVGLEEVTALESVSDVATLIEVFEETVRDVALNKIKSVVRDSENYFYMVISDSEYEFDLFDFICRTFNNEISISSINARYLFPSRLSRGIYEGVVDEEDDDDVATSYLDEDDLDLPSEVEYELYYAKTGVTLKVGSKGVIIGRSPKKVDFLIRGNNNIGRVHCNLYVNKGSLMVHDFDSLNGTFVNNSKVHSSEDVKLVEGDILILADEEFRVI